MSLAEFTDKFKVLHERWGYRYPGTDHSAYEDKTHQGLHEFQHLTDYIMRFLAQDAYASPGDVRRMFIDSNFYVDGGDFNMTDETFAQYLEQFGPYFKANRSLCREAYEYVKTCPPSSTRCLLQVSLQWMKVIRKYYMRYMKKKKCHIRSFKRLLKATAIAECRMYIQNEYGDTIEATTVQEAIVQVQEYDVDTSSGTSDYTSEEDTVDVIDLTGTQLRL